jgi:hypothetical protein
MWHLVSAMQTSFPYLEITKKDRAIVGKKDAGTRIYRFSGLDTPFEKMRYRPSSGLNDDPLVGADAWYGGLCKRFPGEQFVSPGGVSMFVPVSRAAIYKRINAGKLTVFCFHPTEWKRTLFGGVRKSRTSPYMFIPVSECRAWAEELKGRIEAVDDPGFLPVKEYKELEDKAQVWPKHTGKTSTPKWKRKKRARREPSVGGLLSFLL